MKSKHREEPTLIIGPDFLTISIGNEVFCLTPTQGRTFACLLVAWGSGMGGLAGSFVLETARSDSTKLSEVYKRGADGPRVFARFIKRIAKGVYTLDLPDGLRIHATAMLGGWVENLVRLERRKLIHFENLGVLIENLVRLGLIHRPASFPMSTGPVPPHTSAKAVS